MTLKQKIHQQHSQFLQDKIDVFRDRIAALTEDAKNDAKGSAGDKHETALSMMHIEQEKLNHKLSEFITQKSILDKINPAVESTKIGLGSLVQTNNLLLYVSVALPKIVIDGQTIIAVSLQSPLGSVLLGKETGYEFDIHGTSYLIQKIE